MNLPGAPYLLLAGAMVFAGCATAPTAPGLTRDPEARAVSFLMREAPAWRRENGCFSCHNNGDGARALYAASKRGYRVPAEVLMDTTSWLSDPWHWDDNKGDPGFSDKRLADVQFASALLASIESGWTGPGPALPEAARRLLADQAPDGSWPIEGQDLSGAPTTYGPALATSAALAVLQASGLPEARAAVERGKLWLRTAQPANAVVTAVLLASSPSERSAYVQLFKRFQTRDGGWGPFADAPPEVFDTAVVLLALAPFSKEPDASGMIRRARTFLARAQLPDGSWPPTTRPAGGRSYAQQVSTTAWAALALLATRDQPATPQENVAKGGRMEKR